MEASQLAASNRIVWFILPILKDPPIVEEFVVNRLTGFAALLALIAVVSVPQTHAQDSYIEFDDDGNMLLSGPFDLTIPMPPGVRRAGPRQSSPSLLDEKLKVSTAGYFGTDQLLVVQVETTNAGPGTMSDEFLPLMTLAGDEFHAREACIDVTQAQLDTNDDRLFEFVEDNDVTILPAVMAMQVLAVDDTGVGLGTLLFMRNVPEGCEAMTQEFEEAFKSDFEGFIESVRNANGAAT
jgi:hypothetical protein